MTPELHEGPLQGLRVIDLATVFAGPSAARRLADFGAEVIKVERVGDGDGARKLGERDGADGYYWRQIGRNKRPIELDLKQEAGKDVLLRLVRTADVVVENFRPGTMERLGLDPETVLLRENPGLVVLRVTGFGQDGPYASRAGFGTIAEAMSTLAYTTGQPDGPPTLPPIALADEITGALSAFAVLAAIRHRDLTGEGQIIDATLLESMLDVVGPGPAITHRSGISDERIGSRLSFSAPRNVYQCSDGWICMSGSADSVAKRIMQVIGGDDVVNDPRFATNADRLENVDALDALITAWTQQHTWTEAVRILNEAGAAAGPVYSAEQLIKDEHIVGRGSLALVENPHGDGELLQPAVTPRLSLTPGAIRHAGLAQGACTEEILTELGYAPAEIAAMTESGAIGLLPVST
ncbi:MAG: CaiB/BaiF CoA-transferase family protein [Actinobacteria bacterium]|nr:CaiB/BaiF CoA-transferase family protein [Actinomycetota bacterium]